MKSTKLKEIKIEKRWNAIPGFTRVSKKEFDTKIGKQIDKIKEINAQKSIAYSKMGKEIGLVWTYGYDYTQPPPYSICDYYISNNVGKREFI